MKQKLLTVRNHGEKIALKRKCFNVFLPLLEQNAYRSYNSLHHESSSHLLAFESVAAIYTD